MVLPVRLARDSVLRGQRGVAGIGPGGFMASVERTAYPRFRRFLSARELHVFYTPAAAEIACARENASSDEHLLGLVIQLKRFSRLGYFPALDEVPGTAGTGHPSGSAPRSSRPSAAPSPSSASTCHPGSTSSLPPLVRFLMPVADRR